MRAVKKSTQENNKIENKKDTEQRVKINEISELYYKLKEQEEVFMTQIESDIFIYRSLGRKDWKDIVINKDINEYQKEEVICECCVIYPENYDFENCDAGIPTLLANEIIKNSLLDSIDTRIKVTKHYREEMYELDNQITCIIHEAFPNFTLEEIENWGIEKTAKYYSRAEWTLINLRGAPINGDPLESLNEVKERYTNPITSEIEDEDEDEEEQDKKPTTGINGKPKVKLTPEKLAELKAKYPEIDWEHDASHELLDSKSAYIDTTPVALRTPR